MSKYCQSVPDEVIYSDGLVYPKPILYLQLLALVDDYERIWLIDEDISLNNINIDRMISAFKKSFSSSGSVHPLITQPLLSNEDTKEYFKERFSSTWKEYLDEDSFAMVDFVEIMAPIFDSQYLKWLIQNVIVDILPQMYFYRSDNGIIYFLFCL